MSSKNRKSSASASSSARSVAADYNKSIRMTMGGTGKNAKIYSVADIWAVHYKPREETKVFADAVGFNERLSHAPFRIPGREDTVLADDPISKFTGADVNLVSNPPLTKKLLRGLPQKPLRRDGTPYWHFAQPVSAAEVSEGSPEPKSACCYFNESVARHATTVPNISVALLPPGEITSQEEEDADVKLFEKMMRERQERILLQQLQQKQKGMSQNELLLEQISMKQTSSTKTATSRKNTSSPSPKRDLRNSVTTPSSNSASTLLNTTQQCFVPTRPQSAFSSSSSAIAVASLELLEDTIEGAKHKTRDVFKESYTRLPKCTWKVQTVSKKDKEKARNDAASRIQKWYRRCKAVTQVRKDRRIRRAEREEKHRRLLLIRGALEKLQRSVELFVANYGCLRRRLAAVTICRFLRRGCKTAINSAQLIRQELKTQMEIRNRQEAMATKRNTAAIEIQRVWRGVRRRFVTKVMIYVFTLARQTLDEEFFDFTYDCWLYHFTFQRVRRQAATNIQRAWRKFIVRRDYGVATFLNAVDLPCPLMCIARRAHEDVAQGRAADFEEAIFVSPPRYSVASRVFLERGKDNAGNGTNKKMKMSIRELAERLGQEPPVPVSYSREFYSVLRSEEMKKKYEYPSFSLQ